MSHEVIHVTEEAHTAVKAHCRRLGLKMREWASAVLLAAVDAESPVGPVPRREVEICSTTPTDVMERPPFYAGRAKR